MITKATQNRVFFSFTGVMLFFATGTLYAFGNTAPTTCHYHYSQVLVRLTASELLPVETYTPAESSGLPIVLMLHGAGGVFSSLTPTEPPTDNFGEKELARHCFPVLLPHYMEAYGYKSLTSESDMVKEFPRLRTLLSSFITKTEHDHGGLPIYIFGESLGAYLGLSLWCERTELGVVSEISGGLPPDCTKHSHHLSLLISHGSEDTTVPVSEALRLHQYALSNSDDVKMDLYPQTGHYLRRAVRQLILSDTIAFFVEASVSPSR